MVATCCAVSGRSQIVVVVLRRRGRSRRSVTCNLRDERGQALARQLISTADVVCENFRPGTLERWNLGPADLAPHLVMVRVSILGQSGPDSPRPGLDLTAIAMAGLLSITGYPDGPPMKSAVTVADHLTAVFAAQSALRRGRPRRAPVGERSSTCR